MWTIKNTDLKTDTSHVGYRNAIESGGLSTGLEQTSKDSVQNVASGGLSIRLEQTSKDSVQNVASGGLRIRLEQTGKNSVQNVARKPLLFCQRSDI